MLAYHAQTMTGYHGFWHWETCDWCEDCRDNMNDDRAFGVAAARVCHFSQLTPVFQKTTENFSFPELISSALALSLNCVPCP